MPDSSGPDSPLLSLLDDLYPLARVLVGEAGADDLIRTTYRRARDVPPPERPDALRSWLVGLLLETRRDRDDHPSDRGPGDAFGREAARHAAEQTLPVAFAACSAQERALLVLDVLSDASPAELAPALGLSDEDARRERDEARSALRAALRDALTGPERMLVDVALSEDDLRSVLHDVLRQRFQPAPPELHDQVSALLTSPAGASSGGDSSGGASDPESGDDASTAGPGASAGRSERSVPEEPSEEAFGLTAGLVGVGLLVAIVLGGYVVAAVWSTPSGSPSPPAPLSTFVADHLDDVETVLPETDSAGAADHLAQTYGRRVVLPRIADARVAAVGEVQTQSRTRIPVVLYDDAASDRRLYLFAFSYALLDTLNARVSLDAGTRRRLETEATPISRRTASRAVVLWRTRDDVLGLAAPDGSTEAFIERVEP